MSFWMTRVEQQVRKVTRIQGCSRKWWGKQSQGDFQVKPGLMINNPSSWDSVLALPVRNGFSKIRLVGSIRDSQYPDDAISVLLPSERLRKLTIHPQYVVNIDQRNIAPKSAYASTVDNGSWV